MNRLEDWSQEGTQSEFGRILNKDLFLYLVDLEVKRARRYQNFFSLILLGLIPIPINNNGRDLQTCQQTLVNLLSREMRETDILGSLGKDKLVAFLPYADASAGGYAKSRFENILRYYDFKSKGYEVTIDQICFPMNGADTIDIIKNALKAESS